jgi:hypothetical protein
MKMIVKLPAHVAETKGECNTDADCHIMVKDSGTFVLQYAKKGALMLEEHEDDELMVHRVSHFVYLANLRFHRYSNLSVQVFGSRELYHILKKQDSDRLEFDFCKIEDGLNEFIIQNMNSLVVCEQAYLEHILSKIPPYVKVVCLYRETPDYTSPQVHFVADGQDQTPYGIMTYIVSLLIDYPWYPPVYGSIVLPGPVAIFNSCKN